MALTAEDKCAEDRNIGLESPGTHDPDGEIELGVQRGGQPRLGREVNFGEIHSCRQKQVQAARCLGPTQFQRKPSAIGGSRDLIVIFRLFHAGDAIGAAGGHVEMRPFGPPERSHQSGGIVKDLVRVAPMPRIGATGTGQDRCGQDQAEAQERGTHHGKGAMV